MRIKKPSVTRDHLLCDGSTFFHKGLGECGELCGVLIGEPDYVPVFQNPLHNTVQRSTQRLDPIA